MSNQETREKRRQRIARKFHPMGRRAPVNWRREELLGDIEEEELLEEEIRATHGDDLFHDPSDPYEELDFNDEV